MNETELKKKKSPIIVSHTYTLTNMHTFCQLVTKTQKQRHQRGTGTWYSYVGVWIPPSTEKLWLLGKMAAVAFEVGKIQDEPGTFYWARMLKSTQRIMRT